ncbi:unnamed protein product [Lathyrus oleraceus]
MSSTSFLPFLLSWELITNGGGNFGPQVISPQKAKDYSIPYNGLTDAKKAMKETLLSFFDLEIHYALAVEDVPDVRVVLIVLVSSEDRSKKNHDQHANIDRGKAVIRGNIANTKGSKQLVLASLIHLRDIVFPFPLVMVGRLPQTTTEMKECVSTKDYEQVLQPSTIRKSNMLAKSAFRDFRAAYLQNQLAAGHNELLFSVSSSKEVEGLKGRYALAVEKMASFKRECFVLRGHLDKASSFLDEVNQSGSPATLVGHITKLAKLLDEKAWGAR